MSNFSLKYDLIKSDYIIIYFLFPPYKLVSNKTITKFIYDFNMIMLYRLEKKHQHIYQMKLLNPHLF